MNYSIKHTLTQLAIFFVLVPATAQFLEGKKNLEKFEGYFTFHYSETEDKLYLEVPKNRINEAFLYVRSLRTGLGNNDIGLDRGQLGNTAVVQFIKSGNKLLLLQPNLNYRAVTDNELEKRSIKEAFGKSVLFGFNIKQTKPSSYVVDLTPFLMLDAHGVAKRLKDTKQGAYKLDKTRNTLWMERTRSFPKNTEFEALLTFVGTPTGGKLNGVVPNTKNISVVQHHSFVQLPDANYTPREFDPRSGSFAISYSDYSTPIWEPITKRYITRHRLEEVPNGTSSFKPKKPIVYYLDPGTPEPVRSALLEGARWWDQAFAALGYVGAFQVKMLPPNADPMDVRYNVIQWVHRSTRGWSYGGSVVDPRTGEIIKGHVSLGSLRIRQDFMIAQALMNKPFAERDDNYGPMLQMALARIRQLSAHEVGHTLGFAHNFAASANGRASVMDYPHPTLTLKNGEVDFSNAYATGIGAWDKVTVAYSYAGPPPNLPEKQFLDNIINGAVKKGLRYITDRDARPQGGAHPKAHLWDNGAGAAKELEDLLKLRKKAMDNFSAENIRTGEPYTVLEDVFVPLYFYHRYQTGAAVKLVGGMDYNYALKGDGQLIKQVLPAALQKKALKTITETLKPKHLAIPPHVLKLFPPRAYGYGRSRESFKSSMGVAFDALGAAATASSMTLGLVLNPQRANRLVQQKAMGAKNLGLDEVLGQLFDVVFVSAKTGSGYNGEIARTVQFQALQHYFNLAVGKQALPQTKGIANKYINEIKRFLEGKGGAFSKQLLLEIETFRKKPENFKVMPVPKIPDGSPIGSTQCNVLTY